MKLVKVECYMDECIEWTELIWEEKINGKLYSLSTAVRTDFLDTHAEAIVKNSQHQFNVKRRTIYENITRP